MPAGSEAVKRVLHAFEENEWAEVHLSYGDVEIHLSAAERGLGADQTSHESRRTADRGVAQVTSASGTEASFDQTGSGADGGHAAPVEASDAELDDSVQVDSPTPGIFWRAPSPGAPAFVEVGGRVRAGDPLCIVEVMKLMSTISAPIDGTVVRIGAENGEQVESRRTLFHIVPDGR